MIRLYRSEYSFLEGFSTIDEIIANMKSPYDIFCDKESFFGLYEFHQKRKHGVFANSITDDNGNEIIFVPRNENEFAVLSELVSFVKKEKSNRKKIFEFLRKETRIPIVIGTKKLNDNLKNYLNMRTLYFNREELNIQFTSAISSSKKYLMSLLGKKDKKIMAKINKNEELKRALLSIEDCLHINGYLFPNYSIDDDALLKVICQKQLKKIGEWGNEKYQKRFQYEYSIIKKKKLSGYFLIVSDVVNWARKNMAVGTIRGSSGGSLTVYLLNITTMDPIKYKLSFERFLNIERDELPDIDIDISHYKRDLVFKYMEKRFGFEHTAHLSAVVRFGWRGAMRYLQKELNWKNEKLSNLLEYLPHYFKGDLKSLLSFYPLIKKKVEKDNDLLFYLKTLDSLVGTPFTYAVHPSGFFVTSRNVSTISPKHRSDNGEFITHITKDTPLNVLKIDFLGARYLDAVFDTAKDAGLDMGKMLYEHEPNDGKTYKLLRSAKTLGVFQLESIGMRRYLKQLSPKIFEDIVAMISLYRPAPLNGGIVNEYMERRNGRKPVDKTIDPKGHILDISYGLILFQEQVMEIAVSIGGLSWGEANLMRKAMSKRNHKIIRMLKNKFLDGSMKGGNTLERSKIIWNYLEKFASYGFNRSHAVGFAYLTYLSAFLKANYPLLYFKNLMNSFIGMDGLIQNYIFEAKRMGIDVLPPEINKSGIAFSIDNGKLISGLTAIKNVSFETAKKLMLLKEMNKIPYKSFENFLATANENHISIPKDAILSLIQSGTFYKYGLPNELISRYCKLKNSIGNNNLFPVKHILLYGKTSRYYNNDFLQYTYHLPLEYKINGKNIEINGYITQMRKIRTKKGKEMLFVVMENEKEEFELTMFPKLAAIYREKFYGVNPLHVRGILTSPNRCQVDSLTVSEK